MSETVKAIKIEEGAKYAIVVNGVPPKHEAEFASYMSHAMEGWSISDQRFLVLTAPSGLELKFEKVEEENAPNES